MFGNGKTGALVPISATDPRSDEWTHSAFLPAPLTDTRRSSALRHGCGWPTPARPSLRWTARRACCRTPAATATNSPEGGPEHLGARGHVRTVARRPDCGRRKAGQPDDARGAQLRDDGRSGLRLGGPGTHPVSVHARRAPADVAPRHPGGRPFLRTDQDHPGRHRAPPDGRRR